MKEPSIAAHNIVKRFGSVIANDHVDLAAYPGEVLAVVGENGAGKTTLMNILSGLIQPDSGEILLRGTPVRFNSPRDAIIAGIGMVHQHFMLIPVFTVAENVVLGREPHDGVIYADNQARAAVKRLSDQYGLTLTPDDRIENLPVGLQQRVEILKVLYRGSDILIFDEPTAVLTPQETRELFRVLRDMARAGRTIIFITHKLKEVMAISDRVTVLRIPPYGSIPNLFHFLVEYHRLLIDSNMFHPSKSLWLYEHIMPDVALVKQHASDLVTAVLVGAAGAFQLWLVSMHLMENGWRGMVFFSTALFQLGIASALLLRPIPVVHTLGRWGSLAIVVPLFGTMVVPSGGNGLLARIHGLEALLSVLLPLGALAALTVVLPLPSRPKLGFPLRTALTIMALYFPLQLIAAGEVTYTPAPLWDTFSVRWYSDLSGFPSLSPALIVTFANHIYMYLPLLGTLLTTLVAVLLGIATGLTVQLSGTRSSCSTRVGLLAIAPASVAAPVCCGPSLPLMAGLSLPTLTVLGSWAVPLLGLSAALLLADIGWLQRQLHTLYRVDN
jgi:ABC-type multidrug transport system ATPase subunit